MALSFFGLEIKRKSSDEQSERKALQTPIQPEEEGATVITGAGGAGFYAEAHFGRGGSRSWTPRSRG